MPRAVKCLLRRRQVTRRGSAEIAVADDAKQGEPTINNRRNDDQREYEHQLRWRRHVPNLGPWRVQRLNQLAETRFRGGSGHAALRLDRISLLGGFADTRRSP